MIAVKDRDDDTQFEEPSAEMSVDWIEDDLEPTPVGEIELIDDRDVLAPAWQRLVG